MEEIKYQKRPTLTVKEIRERLTKGAELYHCCRKYSVKMLRIPRSKLEFRMR